MIVYSSLTVREAIDKALDRVSQFQTRLNLDYKTVWRFLNNSRREMYAKVMPFKDFAFVRTVSGLGNLTALPADFTRPVRVMLRVGTGNFEEARYVTPKEWWRVTNAARPHTVNQGTARFPVWTMWGTDENVNTGDDRIFFYCFPANATGYMEYHASYGDLPLAAGDPVDTATLDVPYEFEGLVIDGVLERIYAKIGDKDKLVQTYRRVQQEHARIRQTYAVQRQTEAINQEALLNPEPSQTISILPQQQQ